MSLDDDLSLRRLRSLRPSTSLRARRALVEGGTFDPINEFIEAYAEAYAHQLTADGGRLTDQDEMPLLQILVIAKATNGRSYGAFPPVAIQKASLPLFAAIGRLRGYKPSYD